MVGMLQDIALRDCPRFRTVLYGIIGTTMPRTPLRPARRRAATDEPVRSTLTPETWITAATAVLIDQGIDAVRVDVLAKALAVTRGSFYWHFKDREALLTAVLNAWRDAATEQVIHRFEGQQADPSVLIGELISLPFRGRAAERAARVELAIRAWARRDALARQAVDEVDARRLSYISQCFSALGFPIAEARARAFILYAYEVAESLLSTQGTVAQKRERSALLQRLVQVKLEPG
jgi:AcrR family transcriptional regulator